jgi:putative ABC transport system permease protein
MNELFGLSMTYIMIGLLCVMAVAVASVGWVALRNRVMFLVGVRNIPRRRAQTTLIIIGLMLSTLIISTAFGIGDTVDYSITNSAYEQLHSIDEIAQARTGAAAGLFEESESLVSAVTMEQERAAALASSINDLPGVDGAMMMVRGLAAARNESSGLAEPLVLIMGLDADHLAGFESDVETLPGELVSPGGLGPDEIFANESAADKLELIVGDPLTIFVSGGPVEFTVKDIVQDRLMTGAIGGVSEGFVLPLERAQELFGREDQIDMVVISNDGGVREGLKLSKEVTARVDRLLTGTPIGVDETKAAFVEDAEQAGNIFVTFFVVLGLFSIAAGMMLIFLIFVMLAAERKVEMGMVRAIGTKRSHLVQMFMSEGMVYNVGAAAVGCALGIVVSLIMVRLLARIFADLNLGITFHVTPRSLIVSYSIGVVLTFLTVTFSSWRIGALNIVSAIRDVPDQQPAQRRPSAKRPVSLALWLTFKPERLRDWLIGLGLIPGGAFVLLLAVGLFWAASAVYKDSSAVAGTAAVLFGIAGGFAAAAGVALALIGLSRIFQTGALGIVLGVPVLIIGLMSSQTAPYAGGVSLVLLGTALSMTSLGARPRPVFTTAGLTLLVFWLLMAGNRIPPEIEGGIEMFFLSGITMVLAMTFVLVYNADLMLGGLALTGGMMSTLVPSIRTAVAYPLANKFRTGMTIAMIALVMFALVMMSTMNSNFERIFLSQGALGGYDVVSSENPGSPVESLVARLRTEGFNTDAIRTVDKVKLANASTADVGTPDDSGGGPGDEDGVRGLKFNSYPIRGVSDGFVRNTTLKFQARATGFDSDDAIWKALAQNDEYAVIDAFAVPGGGFGDPGHFQLEGIEPADRTFEPIRVTVRDSATNSMRAVRIIGILHTEGSGLFGGLLLSDAAFDSVFAKPESSLHYVRLQDDADPDAVAKGIEKTLVFQGVQAEALRAIIEDFQAQSRGFLYLIQGFMGIGLFVGIAAVGVIAFRTVVERRQQIGMLRAIGYTRRAVALSFIMESSFTALLGIGSGIALGLLLAYQLVSTDDFVPGGIDSFYIPWLQIGLIGGFAFFASLVMTIIPARQASGIPIAEALRYE